MPNQKFLSHVLKSQLMEALKFQYSNVLVHQSQQPASHALQHHAMIAVPAQQQVAQNVNHLTVHRLIVRALNVLLQIAHEMTVHVPMHLAAKSQHLKRLLMTSAKSQRLAQLSL
jgi:3-polyprenyl-4-hydroxybenzoate decarboxylase